MLHSKWLRALAITFVAGMAAAAHADDEGCRERGQPQISFIQFPSPNLAAPASPLTIKGKLSLPGKVDGRWNCFPFGNKKYRNEKLPAVVLLHGTAGIDARGNFYEEALNAAGIATLQIDMWEARGVTGLANRPQLPILTYPDAFSALAFLSSQAHIDPDRIGVLGFSWGGVISLGTSERLYAGQFGGGRKFAAHVANYPVCYGANNAAILRAFGVAPAQAGTQYLNLTGAPVLIQIGSKDSYDNSAAPCQALAAGVNPSNGGVVSVAEYPGAYHDFDRLMVPMTAPDPFANQGSYLLGLSAMPNVIAIPDVAQAYKSRDRVTRFFRNNL
ncbi:MAG: alpha/beta hydrolase fold domain-containing protein [Burkholderiales bacterium]|nr:alpha/beta hydrolase fold domain-containing protein [Burkholderiales bacterium]